MDLKALLNLLATPIEYVHDTLRAFKWSKASPLCPKEKQLHYDILLLAHTVEKGLSISNPRQKFGVEKIRKLLSLLDKYENKWDRFPLEKSFGCLLSYHEWHEKQNYDLGDFGKEIQRFIERCVSIGLEPKGGVKNISKDLIVPDADFENSLKSRFSCRRYLPLVVPADLVDRIAYVAVRTPSQCNRQSSRIHYYDDRDTINKLLLLQGGAEGFRESVFNLFVITSEMSAWSGVKARSQSYVDGSLTAMQVLNACQALGLGACPLNLAVTNTKEKQICNVGGISKGERMIMMIAFGLPERADLIVARSERMPSKNIMIRH
jgi:nitroreductase